MDRHRQTPWHARKLTEVYETLHTSEEGLGDAEDVYKRQAPDGHPPDTLPGTATAPAGSEWPSGAILLVSRKWHLRCDLAGNRKNSINGGHPYDLNPVYDEHARHNCKGGLGYPAGSGYPLIFC